MSTVRAVRRFRKADVDPELVDFVLRHATQAGSAKNRQPWRFVVVRSRDQRARLREWYRSAYADVAAWARTEKIVKDAVSDERQQMTAAAQLAEHFDDVSTLVVVCYVPTGRNPADFFAGASIYPAVQNLLLAARAVGLGATLTTLQALGGVNSDDTVPSLSGELRRILGIPSEVVPAALVPLGWPVKPFTPPKRLPVSEVTFQERWGQPWERR
jgi:nitroreductase